MPQQSESRSIHYYTPAWLVEKCRTVLGEIDLDPCSSVLAQRTVKAKHFYTINGLEQDWSFAKTIFVNPPGKHKDFNPAGVGPWWKKLVGLHFDGRLHTTGAIWIGFSIEQLQTLQNSGEPYQPLDFTTCILRKRVKFDRPNEEGLLEPTTRPNHGNYVTLMSWSTTLKARFRDEFYTLGSVHGN